MTDQPSPEPPKWPVPTIELTAEEVTASGDNEDNNKRIASEQRASDDRVETAANKADDEAAATAERGTDQPKASAPPPPPPRTSSGDLRGLFTHLLAGFAGGLIGVLVFGYGAGYLPVDRLIKSFAAPPPAPDTGALDTLRAEVTELRTMAERAQSQAQEAQALQQRIGALENTLRSLKQAANEGGGSLAQATALSTRIAELGERIESVSAAQATQSGEAKVRAEALGVLRREVAELAGQTAALRERADQPVAATELPAELEDRLRGIGERLSSLEQDIARAQQQAAQGSDRAQAVALAIGLANLQRAVESGKPFTDELASVEKLAPEGVDLAPLKARAETGVPTLTALKTTFDAHARTAASATREQGAPDNWLDRLVASASAVVSVRRATPTAGDDPDAILSRMENQVAAGDIAAAIGEAQALPAQASDAMQPWLDDAQARVGAVQSLDALEARLATRLGAALPAPPATR